MLKKPLCVFIVFLTIFNVYPSSRLFLRQSLKASLDYFAYEEKYDKVFVENRVYLQFETYKLNEFQKTVKECSKKGFVDFTHLIDNFFYQYRFGRDYSPLKNMTICFPQEALLADFPERFVFCEDINKKIRNLKFNLLNSDFNYIEPPEGYERVFFKLIKPASPVFLSKKRVLIIYFATNIFGYKKDGRLVGIDGYFDKPRWIYVFDIVFDNGAKIKKVYKLKTNVTE